VSEPAREKTAPKRTFPKSRRLLRHADFERVYKQGRRHFATHMTVFYLRCQSEEKTGVRVGFTVGKVLGGAVQRNRMKRRLREAVRLSSFGHAVGIDTSIDVVINPKRSLLTVDFGKIQDEIAQAFKLIEKHLSSYKVSASQSNV
jgi:ribonuclease P protein component